MKEIIKRNKKKPVSNQRKTFLKFTQNKKKVKKLKRLHFIVSILNFVKDMNERQPASSSRCQLNVEERKVKVM